VGQQQTLDQSQSRHQAEANALLHGGEQAHEWFWKGLTDPEPHVRLSAVKYLDRLDPQAHRDIFEAALYDPHPQIAQAAQRLVRGKGYTPLKW
jgi:HEAT repeat protein